MGERGSARNVTTDVKDIINLSAKTLPIKSAYLLIFLILICIVGCVFWEIPIHSAIFISLLIACIMALIYKWSWLEIQDMIFDGIKESMLLLLLMPLIGIVIGLWILSGIVPSMVFYGVKLLNPTTFLFLAPVFTALVALSIGTSWGTASTIGLAMMSIGVAMGLHSELLAASLIGALFFGEILSPLAGSANLTATLMGVNLQEHFRALKIPTLIAFGISLVFNLWVNSGSVIAGSSETLAVLDALKNAYVIHWSLLLIPATIIILSWRGVKIIPVLSIGAILGLIAAVVVQGIDINIVLTTIYNGPPKLTSHYIVSNLTDNGGMTSMLSISTLLLLSLGLAGVLERTGVLRSVMASSLETFKGKPLRLIIFTIIAGIFLSMVAGSQALAIMLLIKLVSNAFDKAGLNRSWGTVSVSASAAVIPPLIPWNVNGLFLTNILGVQTTAYFPYSIFCLVMPFAVIVWFVLQRKYGGEISG